MKNIAVIYVPNTPQEIISNNILYKFTPLKYRPFFLKKLPVAWDTIALSEIGCDMITTVQFPCIYEELSKQSEKNINNACKKIHRLLEKLGVGGLVLENRLNKIPTVDSYFNSLDVFHIFKGEKTISIYMMEILKYICSLLRTKLNNVRLGVIVDDVNDEQINFIKKVSREIRFLSILSYNTENLIPVNESIYLETGLAIEVGSNARNTLKDCSILINFSTDEKLIASAKLPEQAVIVNCGREISIRNFKGIIINDICFSNSKIPMKYQSWALQSSFCEAVISQKRNMLGQSNKDIQDYSVENIKKIGYRISGFIGINGKIQKSEFEVLSKKQGRQLKTKNRTKG